jgi:hypothetical protein
MRLIYFIISTILVNPILSQQIIPKGFEDKIDYWYLDTDSICSQITYLYFSNDQDKTSGAHFLLKINPNFIFNKSGELVKNKKSKVREGSEIIFFNNGIGTRLIIDNNGKLFEISNFAAGYDFDLFYSIKLFKEGSIKKVKESAVDSTIEQVFSKTWQTDTIVLDTNNYPISVSGYTLQNRFLRRYKLQENSMHVEFNQNYEPMFFLRVKDGLQIEEKEVKINNLEKVDR